MKVTMVSSSDIGGAGYAAVSLLDALNKNENISCDMLVRNKHTNHLKIYPVKGRPLFLDYVQQAYFQQNIKPGHTLLSLMYSDMEEEYLKICLNYDIIHFHWIANFVSVESISYLARQGKKLIWTFHDLNPMTGGCHYSYGCEKYMEFCSNCSEMVDNKYNITKGMVLQKKRYLPKNLVVVTPSQWLANCARKSAVFKKHRVEVIPNSVALDIFSSHDRLYAREYWHIPHNAKVILYCAEYLLQVHKGYKYFIETLRCVRSNPVWKQWVQQGVIQLLIVGHSETIKNDIQALSVPCIFTDYLQNKEILAKAYSAADVTILPSIEDNFPNVMLESLSCGTPVVGFATGGIPEAIINGQTGFVVPQKNCKALGDAILHILQKDNMREACRKFAEKFFNDKVQTRKYKILYDDILSSRSSSTNFYYNKFQMPTDAKKLLAPYLFDTIKYYSRLSVKQQLLFMNNIKELEDKVLNYMENNWQFMEKLPDESIAIWGVGNFAQKLMSFFSKMRTDLKNKIRGFFDNRNYRKVDFFYELPILDTDLIATYNLKMIIIASLKYEDDIFDQIKKLSLSDTEIIRLGNMYIQKVIFPV